MSDLQHAHPLKTHLSRLLVDGDLEERETQIQLAALLPATVNGRPRESVWSDLLDLQERYDNLCAGTEDPGYEELGDGRCVLLGRRAAEEVAYEELEDALDAVFGIAPAGRSHAA